MLNPMSPDRFDGYRWWTSGAGVTDDSRSRSSWRVWGPIWWVKLGPVSLCRTNEYGIEVLVMGGFVVFSRVYGGFAMRRV